jgi:ribosomal protein L37AE/L43A
MTSPAPVPPDRPPVWRRLLLLLLLAAATALWTLLLFTIRSDFPYLALLLLSGALPGLVCGLGTRLLLAHQRWPLHLLGNFLSLTGGFFLMGFLSVGKFGLTPAGMARARPAELIQLGVGILAALLAEQAWRRPQVQLPAAASPAPARAARPARTATASRVTTRRARLKTPAQPKQAASPPRVKARPRKRKPAVQLTAEEEHRCPYCLELVQTRDPRGIVECKVCHTLHHADCWAVTGTCQVPHLNS